MFKIAIFGPPGSGKSTAASAITQKKPGIRHLEASKAILTIAETINRTTSRQIFSEMCVKFGPTWAADRVLQLVSKEESRPVIVTGVRGFKNFIKLKDNGFFCLYLNASEETLCERLCRRESITYSMAKEELHTEEKMYQTDSIKNDADLILDCNNMTKSQLEYQIWNICMFCSNKKKRVSTSMNCSVCCSPPDQMQTQISSFVCDRCRQKKININRDFINNEFNYVLNSLDKNRPILLGFSGGKDSTGAALDLMNLGIFPILFSVDMGYYPISMFSRARSIANKLGLDYIIFDGRSQISEFELENYIRTANFFDKSVFSKNLFASTYLKSKKSYSVKSKDATPSVRPCRLCRKSVIKSYTQIAKETEASYIFLGMNEWTSLSSSEGSNRTEATAVRRISIDYNRENFTIVHLPFALDKTLQTLNAQLDEYGWLPPKFENFVETNSNSCLLAKSTEKIFADQMGFHPDSSRLSREVIAGFLPKREARKALGHVHDTLWSAREVLEYAGIQV